MANVARLLLAVLLLAPWCAGAQAGILVAESELKPFDPLGAAVLKRETGTAGEMVMDASKPERKCGSFQTVTCLIAGASAGFVVGRKVASHELTGIGGGFIVGALVGIAADMLICHWRN